MADKKKYANVAKVKAKNSASDDAKIEGFYTQLDKRLTVDIATVGKSIEHLEFTSKQQKADLQDEIDDAKEYLKEIYAEVDIDVIGTKAAQKAFCKIYLAQVRGAKEIVAEKKEALESYKTVVSAQMDDKKEEKEELQAILDEACKESK